MSEAAPFLRTEFEQWHAGQVDALCASLARRNPDLADWVRARTAEGFTIANVKAVLHKMRPDLKPADKAVRT